MCIEKNGSNMQVVRHTITYLHPSDEVAYVLNQETQIEDLWYIDTIPQSARAAFKIGSSFKAIGKSFVEYCA